MQKSFFTSISIGLLVLFAILSTGSVFAREAMAGPSQPGVIVIHDLRHDLSPPLREIVPIAPELTEARELPLLRHGISAREGQRRLEGDAALQTDYGPNAMPGTVQNFEGTNNREGVLPPDTNGDVGPNHYVQFVNSHFVIYDKTGNLLYGPATGDTLWNGFGGPCEAQNDGDPIALYDPLADRWLMSQFALPNYPSGPYYQCIAISQTGDPTGAFYRYEFQTSTTKMNDYPKFGVWPDGYYMTANLFLSGNSWAGTGVYAFERDKMLDGQSATMQFFELPASDWGGMLPADLDGSTPPPAGAPNYMVEVIDGAWDPGNWPNDEIHFHKFHVDWDTPSNSTFNITPVQVPITPFDSLSCVTNESRDCIPQPGTSEKLDVIGDRAMYRLAYRNLGDHESLVFNHSVNVGSNRAGVRWYELRDPDAASPAIYQTGTYAPGDGLHRWMGSIAMDQMGNMAVGYSVSSNSTHPSMRYAGRLVGDPLGDMAQGEGSIIAGSGSQTSSYSRWGDYSMMAVDPVDDCTFWFTSEYYASTSDRGWQTRIASFKFPSCNQEPDFTLNATPDSQAVCGGDDAQYDVDIGQTGGFSDPVTLTASGNPAGSTAIFSVNPVTPPGSSTLTIGNTAAAAAGSYTIAIEGTSGSKTHDDSVGLDVFDATPGAPTLVSPVNGATDVSLTPTLTWSAASGADTYTLDIATDAGFTNIVQSANDIAGTSYTLGASLDPAVTYYWRVAAQNPCGAGAYSAAFSFTTASRICSQPNKQIPDNDSTGVSDTITVSDGKTVADLDVYLNTSHDLVGDLIFTLEHVDTGTKVTLIDRPGIPGGLPRGCMGDNIDATIDDEGTDGNAEGMCDNNPAIHGNVVGGDPANTSLLAAFDGEAFTGDWTLNVSDNGRRFTGSFSEWCLAPALSCNGLTNEVTGLTISASGNNAVLNWTDTGATSYKIYRVTDDPYFTPDGSNLLTTVTANTYTDVGALGASAGNYYYKVYGVDNCSPPVNSTLRVGEFDFDLIPGS